MSVPAVLVFFFLFQLNDSLSVEGHKVLSRSRSFSLASTQLYKVITNSLGFWVFFILATVCQRMWSHVSRQLKIPLVSNTVNDINSLFFVFCFSPFIRWFLFEGFLMVKQELKQTN